MCDSKGNILCFCHQYLYNLDLNSAYYDPKTRSMRENPLQEGIKDK